MKKYVCIPLVLINIFFIFSAILVERFVYPGIYKTTFFWGISLYVLVSSVIILLNEREFPFMIWLNVAISLIAIMWFFTYMPKYTANQALLVVKEDIIYSKHTMIKDPVKPIESTNISSFVKGSYRFIAADNPGISVVFNPISGKYDLSYTNDADIIPPTKSIHSLDISFEEEYNLIAPDDIYKKLALISKYKIKWMELLKTNYHKLYSVLTVNNRNMLNNELKEWYESLYNSHTLNDSILSQRYADSVNIDLYLLETETYSIRFKALELERMYNKID